MAEPTEITVRGDIFDVMDILRTKHAGHVIKSITMDAANQIVVAVVCKSSPLLLSSKEAYLMHHSIHLALASVVGDIGTGIQALDATRHALDHLDETEFLAYQKKMSDYMEFYNDKKWDGEMGNAASPFPPGGLN